MREIPLTQGKVALVDDEDYEGVIAFRWYAHKIEGIFYAMRTARGLSGQHSVLLHREIMNAPPGVKVLDHGNGDGLNCQRYNLRLATDNQNAQNRRLAVNNTSGFKGVYRIATCLRWAAQIKVNRKLVYVGCFRSAIEAANAYDAKALELHGDFARLTFPMRGKKKLVEKAGKK